MTVIMTVSFGKREILNKRAKLFFLDKRTGTQEQNNNIIMSFVSLPYVAYGVACPCHFIIIGLNSTMHCDTYVTSIVI